MTALPASRSLRLTMAAVAASMFAVAAPYASAAPSSAVLVARVVVNYADLKLDTEQGAAALQRRLEVAAHRVCGTPDGRELRLSRQARDCAAAAVARAVEEVGSPQLAKLNAARNRPLRG